ncbi:alpha/beta hydrolase [Thalassomonas actiniarum]|uniref:Alpha/beta hydrolase n=1 Tax=Thalassomonas actiniarum TaxID=485447 RepID=A0AAE9YSB6_9GAMM|nr:alpha/beta fold hydrolase [Thalassomonas actiniarum]WDE00326.1 alpha/beta hydrolase [Thalassomonas actiniarum]
MFARLIFTFALILGLSGCQSLFFWPTPELVDSPKRFGFNYENVEFQSSDQTRLHGWYLSSALSGENNRGTVYFLHGNATNLSYHIANLYWLTEYGWNVFIIDYRGYGRSEGEPDFQSVIQDASSGYQWLRDRGEENIIIIGQSLGGAIATGMLGLNKDIRVFGLILDSTFASHREIFRDILGKSWLFWGLQIPLSWSISDDYAPQNFISGLSHTPLLIVHSDADRVINKKHSESLYARAGGVKRLWIAQDLQHGAIWQDKYWQQQLICQLAQWPKLMAAEHACSTFASQN